MAKVKAQIVLNRDGALPEDVITNTLHFESDGATIGDGGGVGGTSDVPGLVSRLVTFYQGLAQAGFVGTLTDGTGRIKIYDMSVPSPGRIPYSETPFTYTSLGTPLPAEVAVCLSFRAAPAGGAVPARRRGRIYLGPISSNVVADPAAGGNDVRPTQAKIQSALALAETMATGAAGTYRLSVFSPTQAGVDDTADQAWNDVVELWMDNSLDTVRSRGAKRTARYRTLVGSPAADFAAFA